MEKCATVNIEIPDDEPTNNHDRIVNEWVAVTIGNKTSQMYTRKRQIEKVPPLLLKGSKNRDYYEPAVVSLGPYHHNKTHLGLAEKFKSVTLEEYVSGSTKTVGFFYDKVSHVAHEARNCYMHDSTKEYDDNQFTLMMLRDGCFILFFIECLSHANTKALLFNEYIGALGFANVVRDVFLLENQIPFLVLRVLMDLRFPDGGEDILRLFFNYLNHGEVIRGREKVLASVKQPLHLLELYRSYFISLSFSPIGSDSTPLPKENAVRYYFNYVKRSRSFSSVTELKAKGIFLKATHIESLEHIKFNSYRCYGELELVRRAVSANSKPIFLNMIAYEMCPHNPNDYRISTYVRVMKSLIVHRDDVRELRSRNILLHSLGRDEEVVKMYEDIETPGFNPYLFNKLRKGIEKHCKYKYKTWMAELINVYFSSPWKTMAVLVASAILFTSFLQTYFTIWPCK